MIGFMLILPLALSAQEQDFQIWSRFALKYDASASTRIYIEEEFRFRENAQRLDKNHTELGIAQDLTDRFRIGGFYRFISIRDNSSLSNNRHRFAIQASYDIDLAPWTLWVRPRFQSTFGAIGRSSDWNIPEHYLRTETGISRRPKGSKTEYHADIEWWFPIGRGMPFHTDQYRFTAGVEFRIDRNRRIDLAYRLQQELQVNNPERYHIICLTYTHLIR